MKRAFTLIELSIVLAIAAIIAGNLLSIATDRSEADKVKETEIILDKIEQALADYFTEYGSIPCPGDASINQNSSNFGKSIRGAIVSSTCNGTGGQWYSGGSYIYFDLGVIPTKELQIPDELAFDAWGRRITYAMVEWCNISSNQYLGSDPNTTNYNYYNYGGSDTSGGKYFSNWCAFPSQAVAGSGQLAGSFQIKDASGTIINPNAGIPYVLISHGKNGHGAYPHNGGSTRINAAAQNTSTTAYNLSADEILNAHMNPDGSNITFTGGGIYIQKAPDYSPGSNYFDDIVRYKTKEQLIKSSGKLPALNTITDLTGNYINGYSTNLCQLFFTVLTNISNKSNYYCEAQSPNICEDYLFLMSRHLNSLCI